MIRASEVRCGHDTPGPEAGQGEVLAAFLRYGRDFVHVMIDNPAKRIIFKIGNKRNTADKEKQGIRRLTFFP
jgi:hypothetical protein